jgi:hypothetical protein
MKVIDLLNKIANGEEVPKKIKYYDLIYEFCSRCKQYEHFDKDKTLQIKLFEEIVDLNDEIEIIEDKKITKLNTNWQYAFDIQVEQDTIEIICKKVNEIIDKVNGE